MKKQQILKQLNIELNQVKPDSNSSKKIKALNALIIKTSLLLNNSEDYKMRVTVSSKINEGDLVEYLVLSFLKLNTKLKTPNDKGADITDKRYKYNEIKACINPSQVGFISDLSKNYIVATCNCLFYCKGKDLAKNLALTSLTKNGYRVKKAWCQASATKIVFW